MIFPECVEIHCAMTLQAIKGFQPGFTETEKPGNPEIFQNRKTVFRAPKTGFSVLFFGHFRTFVITVYLSKKSLRQCTSPQHIRNCTQMLFLIIHSLKYNIMIELIIFRSDVRSSKPIKLVLGLNGIKKI
jgi:hypothetical protein